MEENSEVIAETEDSNCFLDIELEALQSIYINETDIQKEEHFTVVSIDLHPATADKLDEQYVKMTLKLTVKEGYPDTLPDIDIRNPRGLSDEKLISITEDLFKVAENKKGNSMLFEIIEAAKDHLTAGNRPCEECAICLYGFHEEDVFTKTECYHYFHSHCLSRYVKHVSAKNDDSDSEDKELLCPVCRFPIKFEDLEKDFPPPIKADYQFVLTDTIIEMQKKMSDLYLQQVEKGGIIDLEAEKNKYLLEISNVPDSKLENEESDLSQEEIRADEDRNSYFPDKESGDDNPESVSHTDSATKHESENRNRKSSTKKYEDRQGYNGTKVNKNRRYDRESNERFDASRSNKYDNNRRNFRTDDYRKTNRYEGDRRTERYYDGGSRNNNNSNRYYNDRRNFRYENERRNFNKYSGDRRNNRYESNRSRTNRYEDATDGNKKLDKAEDQLDQEVSGDEVDEARGPDGNGQSAEVEYKLEDKSLENEDEDHAGGQEDEVTDRRHNRQEDRRSNKYDRQSDRYNGQKRFDDRRNYRGDGRKYAYGENRMNGQSSYQNYRGQRRNEQYGYDRRRTSEEDKYKYYRDNRTDRNKRYGNRKDTEEEREGEILKQSSETERLEDNGASGVNESVEERQVSCDREDSDFPNDRSKFSNKNTGARNRFGNPNYNSRYPNSRKFNAPKYSNYRSRETFSKAESIENESENTEEVPERSNSKKLEDSTNNESSSSNIRSVPDKSSSQEDFHHQSASKKNMGKNRAFKNDREHYDSQNYNRDSSSKSRGGGRYRQSDYSKPNSRTSSHNYSSAKQDGVHQNSQNDSNRKAEKDKNHETVVHKSGSCDEIPSQSSSKSAAVDNSVPTSNFLPPMSSSVAPPPGFQNPTRKVVYGLAAANPPPGFNRS